MTVRVRRAMEMKPEKPWTMKPILGRGDPDELGHRAIWFRLPFGRWVRKVTRGSPCPHSAVIDGGSYTISEACLRLKGHTGQHKSLSHEWAGGEGVGSE